MPGLVVVGLNMAVLAEVRCICPTLCNIVDGENHDRGVQSQQLFGRFETYSSDNDDDCKEGIDFRLDDVARDGYQEWIARIRVANVKNTMEDRRKGEVLR